MSGINCRPGTAWEHLKSIEIHTLDDKTYDRRGRIASLIFRKFPNQDYQKASTIFAVRTLTSLLAPHYSLMDLEEYAYDEMNDCWLYYDNPLNSHRQMCADDDLVVVAIMHKYWYPKQIDTFKEMLESMAFLHSAPVVHT